MSTKIYDAFATKTKLHVIIQKLVEIRELYNTIICSKISEHIIYEACWEFDSENHSDKSKYKDIEDKNDFNSFLNVAFNEVLENDENQFTSQPIARLSIGLYPLKNKTLITVHGSYDMVQLFIKNESEWLGSEYEYWDNTDKPETISTREWNKRCKDWDIVFDKYYTRVESMLTYSYCEKIKDIYSMYAFFFMKSNINHMTIPTDEYRKRNILFNKIFNDIDSSEYESDGKFDFSKYNDIQRGIKEGIKNGTYDNKLSLVELKPFNNKLIDNLLEKK